MRSPKDLRSSRNEYVHHHAQHLADLSDVVGWKQSSQVLKWSFPRALAQVENGGTGVGDFAKQEVPTRHYGVLSQIDLLPPQRQTEVGLCCLVHEVLDES